MAKDVIVVAGFLNRMEPESDTNEGWEEDDDDAKEEYGLTDDRILRITSLDDSSGVDSLTEWEIFQFWALYFSIGLNQLFFSSKLLNMFS